jgi:hypothetical protein
MGFDFASKLKMGLMGESDIAKYFNKKGYNVLPVYEKQIDTGKGPTLFAYNGSQYIAPDMLVFKDRLYSGDDALWIEAKTKTAFTWYRAKQVWNTGIDLRHFRDYVKVSRLSPFKVFLVFLHLGGIAKDTPPGMVSPTGLFTNSLKYLAKNYCHKSKNWGRSGMVYWEPGNHLVKIASLEEIENLKRT